MSKNKKTVPYKNSTPVLNKTSLPTYTATHTQTTTIYASPFPPPEILERYERILPGTTEKILKNIEIQRDHRMKMESKVITSNIVQTYLGQAVGFVVAMTAIILGYLLIMNGKEVTGIVSIIGCLVALVGIFVYGKKTQTDELKSKREKLLSESNSEKPQIESSR